MSDAPERIWLTGFVKDQYGARLGRGTISDLDHSPNPDYPEYVRADRIKELEDHLRMAVADKEAAQADRELLKKQITEMALQSISDQGQAIDAYEAQKEAEAKLEKAVEGLELMVLHAHGLEKQLTEDLFHQDFCGESVTLTVSRTTLAELKGQDDGNS